jgi:arylsulfatase A-like enzyme
MRKNNILFIFPDQHRGDWLPYGEAVFKSMGNEALPLKMDSISFLMENGVTFNRAITNSPLCVPARACLASGLEYKRCGCYNNDYCYPLDVKTFYSVLKDNGYNVGGVGKFDLHKPILYWTENGWLDQLSRLGFTNAIDSEGKYDLIWSSFYKPAGPYSAFLHKEGLLKKHAKDYIVRYYNTHKIAPTSLPDYAYSDNWVGKNALAMIDEFIKQDKPWFLQVNFTGPHNPWDITASMRKRWENVEFPLPAGFEGDAKLNMQVCQNYAAMLENIDRNIGLFIEKLKSAKQFEHTLIVYASDHGEMLGDKGRYFKSVPYRGALNIPLIISGPEVAKGIISGEPAELCDLAATFAEYGGGKLPEGRDGKPLMNIVCGHGGTIREYQRAGLDNSVKYGKPYADYLEYECYKKRQTDDEYIEEFNKELRLDVKGVSAKKFSFKKDWDCLINGNYKFIQYSTGENELYDVKLDRGEMHNIAETMQDTVSAMKKMLQD